MKTKEEIEQLASKRFIIKQFIGEDDYNRSETIAARYGFEEGYTQCQEDNKNKKYTEEDMIKFANQYSSINILHLKEHLKEFTLNKQDNDK